MKIPLGSVIAICVFCLPASTQGCINDSKTLWMEKFQHPTLANAILHPQIEPVDVPSLNLDLQYLKANPRTNDAAWWNELAGAYLRLGRPGEAIKLLEPVTNRFNGNYGIHANLGTAYHLAGQYLDAEREIRRGLEINPQAHAGLEKYHLALLQYLKRHETYRERHVYVNEFTYSFLKTPGRAAFINAKDNLKQFEPPGEIQAQIMESQLSELNKIPLTKNGYGGSTNQQLQMALAESDLLPQYTGNWDMGNEPELENGVIYMSVLNPKEPACWVMLGLVAEKHRDFNLAMSAYTTAISLNSPQTRILEWRIENLKSKKSGVFGFPPSILWLLLIIFVFVYFFYCKFRDSKRNRKTG